ncbi:MAG TPA: ATP-grasp domain-containing protein [Tenuifilaceae bacterium]|nr:ATP-grasp domain-containing protein [Tenuifilaceae bacterium]HPE17037.1 ATP-grasp domain-containing protein [Tenuifilaceae bacterium]HPJ44678.1 ATP-grasp domain-containing protein [Tenuifilaceae bacterium]HPQ32942.1 ATP-grasp domain-containing protein [Tenuifilaceae bacterium]HRX66760.1 ATP-grasp domain-containing protein [Tenuifilaceae bacterium]
MIVGLTYDLRNDYLKEGYTEEETAEFDAEVTIDAIDSTLKTLGFQTERIGNVKALINDLNKGKRWDLIFNICEGMHGIGREAQVPAILDAYQIPYVFSDPLVLALTLHKGHTKRIVRDFGIPTADFTVVQTLSDVEKVNLPYPLFAKPVAEGTGKGIDSKSIVDNPLKLVDTCERLLSRFNQPVLVETFLPGREFTVGIVGTGDKARVLGVMEIVVTEKAAEPIYSMLTKETWHGTVDYPMATGLDYELCADTALRAWRALDCRDGGRIDLKMDENGVPNFIEVNPLAGINPDHSDLPMLARKNGISYTQMFSMIMESALERVKIPAKI